MKLSLCLFLSFFFTIAEPKTLIQEPCKNDTVLIQETCKACSQNDPNLTYDFCVTSLRSGRRCAANLRGLGLFSVGLIRRNVTSTRRHVRTLLRDKKWDPFSRVCLEDCFELYSDAVSSLNDVVEDYKAERYRDANVELSAVMEASVTCEDGFYEQDGLVSPLTKRNNDTYLLSAIALSIVTMLDDRGPLD